MSTGSRFIKKSTEKELDDLGGDEDDDDDDEGQEDVNVIGCDEGDVRVIEDRARQSRKLCVD